MKMRWTSVVWSVVYLLLLLSLLSPLSIVTVFFLILPATILFATLNLKSFLLHAIPVWLIAFIVHPVNLLLAAYFLIPAIVMGRAYKKKAPALRTLMTGAGIILAEMLVLLLIGTVFLNFDLSSYVDDIVKMTTSPLKDVGGNNPLMTDMAWTPEDMRMLSNATMQMIPFAMIISSFMMAVITHSLARPIIESMGQHVPKMKPAREWMMPRSLIWYYLIGVVIEIFARSSSNSYMTMIAANLVPLLHICFMIQAIGFFYYLGHTRKWHPVIPLLFAIPILLFPPMRIIGILDLAFPLRQFMTKSKR
ncbi:membrane protein [Paenibacillus sp. J23TS9]|nr:membrane protein [Paenibacillus sp. J23TS9]